MSGPILCVMSQFLFGTPNLLMLIGWFHDKVRLDKKELSIGHNCQIRANSSKRMSESGGGKGRKTYLF